MKLIGIGYRSVAIWVALIGLCVASGAGGASPYQDTLSDGQINMGSASIFTVLTRSNDTIRNGSVVRGSIGIYQGKFTLTDGSDVFGNLLYRRGVVIRISSGSRVHGQIYSDDPVIDGALMDAKSLSDAAWMEPVTARYADLTSVNLNGSSLTISGGANEKVVLKLTDFILTNDSVFTLSGTATTAFIINVMNTFSLASNSTISLLNVPASNVLFNIRGTGTTVELTGGSTMSGTLLALRRTVRLRHRSRVVGRIIAYQNILSNSSLTPTTNQ
jgi:small nuclear ribonucleoprotein (snRNP)-like protein